MTKLDRKKNHAGWSRGVKKAGIMTVGAFFSLVSATCFSASSSCQPITVTAQRWSCETNKPAKKLNSVPSGTQLEFSQYSNGNPQRYIPIQSNGNVCINSSYAKTIKQFGIQGPKGYQFTQNQLCSGKVATAFRQSSPVKLTIYYDSSGQMKGYLLYINNTEDTTCRHIPGRCNTD